jgi:hypothetical protein
MMEGTTAEATDRPKKIDNRRVRFWNRAAKKKERKKTFTASRQM